MECLEIGMPWRATTPKCNLSSDTPQAGPSDMSREAGGLDEPIGKIMDTMGPVNTINEDCTLTGEEETKAEGMRMKVSKKRRKQKPVAMEEEDILNRFGPPRQSIRSRIRIESQATPEIAKEPITPKFKKTKMAKLSDTSNHAGTVKAKRVKKEREEGKRRKGEEILDTTVIPQKTAKKRKPMVSETNPAMKLTEEDIMADEIIAYQPGSLEGMGVGRAESSKCGMTLEERLREKKRKTRKNIVSKVEQDSDEDPPLVEIGSLHDPGPGPIKRGIRSSTFARVMRLVADMPQVEAKSKRMKRCVPEHRPPVWAMACLHLSLIQG
jgi:hypothetical protein